MVAIGFPYSGIVWRDAWPRAMANFVAASKATRARMVFIDNLYMYGPQTAPLVETMPLADYGWKPAARSAATRIWMDAAAAGEALIAALRAPDFYGPGVGQSYLGDASIGNLARGKPAVFVGSPDVLHDYAYVPDIARAATTLLAAPDSAFGQAWHVPHAPTRTTRDILKIAADALEREASHQRHAGLDAGRERDVLAVPAGIDRDALPMRPALSRRREPLRRRLLVGRDAVRDRRPRDRARVPRRVEGQALRAAWGCAVLPTTQAFQCGITMTVN